MAQTLIYGVVAFAIFAVISFVNLRSWSIALAVTLGPIPGLLLAQQFAHTFVLRDKIVIVAFCLVLFELLAAAIVERLVDDQSRDQSRQDNAVRWFFGLSCASLIAFAVGRFWLNNQQSALGIFITAFSAIGSSAALLFLGVRFSGVNESFATTVNRNRERGERLIETITAVALPRWGFSVVGIGLVLTAMAFFGVNATSAVSAQNRLLLVLAPVIALVTAYLRTRDWRRALAAFLIFVWLGLIEAWFATVRGTVLRDSALTIYVMTLAIAFIFVLAMSAQHWRFASAPEAVDGAAVQAIVAVGRSLFFAMLGAIAFLGVWHVGKQLPFWSAATMVVAGVASLLLYAATVLVIETLFFRRRSVEEIYKLK